MLDPLKSRELKACSVVSLTNGQDAIDDEAAAFRDLYFADYDNIVVRHYPDCRPAFLHWQIGVVEPDTIQYNGSTFEVELFHLFYFAPTKDDLIALLEATQWS